MTQSFLQRQDALTHRIPPAAALEESIEEMIEALDMSADQPAAAPSPRLIELVAIDYGAADLEHHGSDRLELAAELVSAHPTNAGAARLTRMRLHLREYFRATRLAGGARYVFDLDESGLAIEPLVFRSPIPEAL